MPDADDDLEPIVPVEAVPPPEDDIRGPVLRDRFLVALALVVAAAVVVFAIQLRAIARDTAHDAECSEALVALVSSSAARPNATSQEVRDRLDACLGR